MVWARLSLIAAMVLVSCTTDDGEVGPLRTPAVATSGGVLPGAEAGPSALATTPDTVPIVSSFQLEMSFLNCMRELEAETSDFEARSSRCEIRVFGESR